MQRVLVTGGAGFIGSHIVEALVKADHETVVIDNLLTGKLKNIEHLISDIKIERGDITDSMFLRRMFEGIDCVIHLAALRSVPDSFENPGEYMRVNVGGTENVLEAAKETEVKRVVIASSSSVYGEGIATPFREEVIGRRISPYAVSKYEAERLTSRYNDRRLEIVILRYFNVFGPRQDQKSKYANAVPAFITALLKDRRPVIYWDGKQTRDFTYVENIVEGTLLAMTAKGVSQEVFNIGQGKSTSVNELLRKIQKIIGKEKIAPLYKDKWSGDMKHTLADITKAREKLGYRGKISLEEGLEKTVEYFRENADSM